MIRESENKHHVNRSTASCEPEPFLFLFTAHPNRHYISPQMATEEHLRHEATGVPRNGRDEQKKLPPFVENNNPDIDGNPFYKAPILEEGRFRGACLFLSANT
ncbi:hypothetical protein AVEN_245355-1 [Araneus ventricosus]|uniref:Uncharacterized protein n=1 Tax=Araneus ventricosus TaxID=182803 RepID=A0A4Y2PYR9_ARAVE|nr:hypothetical protein AVEN_245355-1 [Araneus ventricosus]